MQFESATRRCNPSQYGERGRQRSDDTRASDGASDAIIDALEGLSHGQLALHLHDARLVRIMRTQKIRLYEGCADGAHDDAVR
jgi:hypothetical protein